MSTWERGREEFGERIDAKACVNVAGEYMRDVEVPGLSWIAARSLEVASCAWLVNFNPMIWEHDGVSLPH